MAMGLPLHSTEAFTKKCIIVISFTHNPLPSPQARSGWRWRLALVGPSTRRRPARTCAHASSAVSKRINKKIFSHIARLRESGSGVRDHLLKHKL
ncbi:hypothetical protein T492DRAFT_362024 [Pavlovales sp. CCMP2436]|nr:hypothetical protein T492DRAFT_362024 [Pavlovales sp. CCMP2436]